MLEYIRISANFDKMDKNLKMLQKNDKNTEKWRKQVKISKNREIYGKIHKKHEF
jgi:hypothetical protein